MIKVKVFDENHETDLENSINAFLSKTSCDIIDVKFSSNCAMFSEDQIFCFSALIIYNEE